jgi:hypothetical protein
LHDLHVLLRHRLRSISLLPQPGGYEDVLIESREARSYGRLGVKSMSLACPCRQPALEHSGPDREGAALE